MKKKEFKTESKRILDLMINSIYTNKEIFLRELISNASDAIDKLYYLSLTDSKIKINREDLEIFISYDEKAKTLSIKDNGIGMNESELENNLGVIAESGSLTFKEENKNQKDVNIIGQFGVGFYSSFMVADKVTVYTKKINEDKGYLWQSSGADGYTIEESHKEDNGTIITLYLKDDNEDEKYSEYLTEYRLRSLIKKYSDYITYPIKMEVENSKLKNGSDSEYETIREVITINSMIPIWKKNKNDVTEDEYQNFYTDKFYDYEKSLKVIHSSVEGLCSYKSLLFIPSHSSYDYYTKEFKKGLQLYTNGVLIMDKCEDLLPDYYSFVKGVVDSEDLALNISRETLQQNKNIKIIAKSLETKIHSELLDMLKNDFLTYKTFFKQFGMQIKYGVYNNYGIDKEKVMDLLVFYSANKKDYITLDEYVDNMKKKQDTIYYACGETIEKIDLLPQVEKVRDNKYDILYLAEYVDEFAIKAVGEYKSKKFVNVCSSELNLDSKEETDKTVKLNADNKDLLDLIKSALNNAVVEVKFTNKLKNHPVCLSNKGEISIEMQKVLNAMPGEEKVNAEEILEINENHPITEKLIKMSKKDKDGVSSYAKILYAQARLIEGLPIDNPTEISNLIIDKLA